MADDKWLIREMNDEQQLLQMVRFFAVSHVIFNLPPIYELRELSDLLYDY